MYLFTRAGVLTGDPAVSMTWAAKIGGYVSTKTGRSVTTWAANFGQPLGSVVWSTWLASHADVNAAFGELEADAGYQAMVGEAADFATSPHEMTMRQVVFGGPGAGDEAPPIGALAIVTSAVAAGGKLAEAIGWGSEVAKYVTDTTGFPVTFLVDSYGPFGQVTWIGGAPDLAAVDASNDTLNADAGYMKFLAQAGDLFVNGSGQRSLFARIG